jgi:hypothetical protein
MSNMTPQSHIDLMQRISCIVVIDTKVPLPKPCYFAGPYSISMHKSEQQRYYRILNGWCRFRNCVVLACWANWKIEVLSWPLCNSGLCIGVKHDPVKIIFDLMQRICCCRLEVFFIKTLLFCGIIFIIYAQGAGARMLKSYLIRTC